MKVCLVMFFDDNIKDYGNITYEINKKYCEKYKLELILSNNKKLDNRYPAWERLPLLLDNISNYDYIMWIDADAFFYNDANNILDIINNNLDVNFIFSNCIRNKNINTGFFIVKNTQYSIDFLTKWAYDEVPYRNNPYPYMWDQGVLVNMYEKNMLNIQQNSVKYEYGHLQHFYENDKVNDKSYILHLAGRHSNTRYSMSKEYLDTLTGI